jgi:hypothetical protein
VNGQVIVKVFLQPHASLDTANARVTAISQTILRQMRGLRRHSLRASAHLLFR